MHRLNAGKRRGLHRVDGGKRRRLNRLRRRICSRSFKRLNGLDRCPLRSLHFVNRVAIYVNSTLKLVFDDVVRFRKMTGAFRNRSIKRTCVARALHRLFGRTRLLSLLLGLHKPIGHAVCRANRLLHRFRNFRLNRRLLRLLRRSDLLRRCFSGLLVCNLSSKRGFSSSALCRCLLFGTGALRIAASAFHCTRFHALHAGLFFGLFAIVAFDFFEIALDILCGKTAYRLAG